MMRLWRGELPLFQSFWGYLVVYGLAINLVASAAALVIYVMTGSVVTWLVVHFLPLPYNVMAVGGTWRAAARHPGKAEHAVLARVAGLVIFALYLFL